MKIGRGRPSSMARSGRNRSVSTPRVHMPRLPKPRRAEFGHQRWRRHHRDGRGGVEAAQRRVDPAFGDRHARRDVFGKSRRIARGERPAAPFGNRPAPCSRSALRSRCGSRPAWPARCGARSACGSAAPGAIPDRSAPERCGKPSGRQEVDADAERLRAARERGQGAHHAVDLRMPGIRRDEYPHQADLGRPRSVGWRGNRMRQHCDFMSQSCDYRRSP